MGGYSSYTDPLNETESGYVYPSDGPLGPSGSTDMQDIKAAFLGRPLDDKMAEFAKNIGWHARNPFNATAKEWWSAADGGGYDWFEGAAVPLTDGATLQGGGTWTNFGTGAAYITSGSGRAVLFSATGQPNGCVTEAGGNDHGVIAKMSTVATSSGLCWRWTDASNFYMVVRTAGGWQVRKRVTGTTSNVGGVITSARNQDNVIIEAVMIGSAIKIYADGDLIATKSDGSLTTGTNAGLVRDAPNTGGAWAGFMVRPL